MTVGIGRGGRALQIVGNTILLLGVFLTVVPFLYMISASFKPGYEIYSIPFQVLPESLYRGNYDLLFGETSFVRWFGNSLFVGIVRTVIAIVLSLMAGYA
ncbi:MAG: carbohydrate ABC transporter permease, partial [Chloroflexota bacterium]|nr:carbohydrate ABC transporter permease [Chloroflexota bacterium]